MKFSINCAEKLFFSPKNITMFDSTPELIKAVWGGGNVHIFTALVSFWSINPYLKVECLMFSWLAGGWRCGQELQKYIEWLDWSGYQWSLILMELKWSYWQNTAIVWLLCRADFCRNWLRRIFIMIGIFNLVGLAFSLSWLATMDWPISKEMCTG